MKLVYSCGSEAVGMIIDRKTKTFEIANSKTNYALMKQPWKMLFDKGKEEQQEKKTDLMTDEEFIKEIDNSMAKVGYLKVKVG